MAKRNRSAVACARCKASKYKCSDYRPCKHCVSVKASCKDASDIDEVVHQDKSFKAAKPGTSGFVDYSMLSMLVQNVQRPHSSSVLDLLNGMKSHQGICTPTQTISNPRFHLSSSAQGYPDYKSYISTNRDVKDVCATLDQEFVGSTACGLLHMRKEADIAFSPNQAVPTWSRIIQQPCRTSNQQLQVPHVCLPPAWTTLPNFEISSEFTSPMPLPAQLLPPLPPFSARVFLPSFAELQLLLALPPAGQR